MLVFERDIQDNKVRLEDLKPGECFWYTNCLHMRLELHSALSESYKNKAGYIPIVNLNTGQTNGLKCRSVVPLTVIIKEVKENG